MAVFKKGLGYKGGSHSSHGGSRFGRSGGGGAPKHEFFAATCSSCGKACEVPFRPSSDRPVFCRDCFATQDRDERLRTASPRFEREGGYQKREFTPRDSSPTHGGPAGDVSKQIEALSKKIDALTRLVEDLSR